MIKDLCVTEILNVYKNDTVCWNRREPRKRSRNGLVLFLEGEIEYFFPNQTIVAPGGTVMLFPSDVAYHGIARTERVAYCVLDFKTLSENELSAFGAPYIARLDDFEELKCDFFDVLSAWERQKIDAPLRARAFLYSALARLAQNAGDGQRAANAREDRAIAYILEHYTEPELSVSLLCEKFYLSESQLRRNVLGATGVTTNEYIASLRLNLAKRELLCTRRSIKEIALECGFGSAYYFSRCFHRREGLSPREYRQINSEL